MKEWKGIDEKVKVIIQDELENYNGISITDDKDGNVLGLDYSCSIEFEDHKKFKVFIDDDNMVIHEVDLIEFVSKDYILTRMSHVGFVVIGYVFDHDGKTTKQVFCKSLDKCPVYVNIHESSELNYIGITVSSKQ